MKIGSVVSLSFFLSFAIEGSVVPQSGTVAIALTEKGVGPITSTTPFKITTIAKLFPTLRVVAGTGSFEGFQFPTIRVFDGKTELFIIGQGKREKTIGGIAIKSDKVVYNGKGKIGSLYSDIYGDTVSDQCDPGAEDDTGKVFCRASPSSHIRFVFAPVSDSDAVLPWTQALKRMRISEIGWRP